MGPVRLENDQAEGGQLKKTEQVAEMKTMALHHVNATYATLCESPDTPSTAEPEFGHPDYWDQTYRETFEELQVEQSDCTTGRTEEQTPSASSPSATATATASKTTPAASVYYDWVLGWDEVKDILLQILEEIPAKTEDTGDENEEIEILHIGNGNSIFPEELFKLGYRQQLVTDISGLCMDHMQSRWDAKYATKGGESVKFLYADGCDLAGVGLETAENALLALREEEAGAKEGERERRDEEEHQEKILPSEDKTQEQCSSWHDSCHFDLVFEKSTMDAMFCFDGPHAWLILHLLKEAYRVLTPRTGKFVCMSMHPPSQVTMYFDLPCFDWKLERVEKIVDPQTKGRARENHHYVYVLGSKWTHRQLLPEKTVIRNSENDATTAEQEMKQQNGEDILFSKWWHQVRLLIAEKPDEDPKIADIRRSLGIIGQKGE
ncbi:unnamed protein product [Amoebophrya sp. A25]|nr:unnamed protein product [Amoebophrya sp. A25]|eukprot:GSA25T00024797001.1